MNRPRRSPLPGSSRACRSREGIGDSVRVGAGTTRDRRRSGGAIRRREDLAVLFEQLAPDERGRVRQCLRWRRAAGWRRQHMPDAPDGTTTFVRSRSERTGRCRRGWGCSSRPTRSNAWLNPSSELVKATPCTGVTPSDDRASEQGNVCARRSRWARSLPPPGHRSPVLLACRECQQIVISPLHRS